MYCMSMWIKCEDRSNYLWGSTLNKKLLHLPNDLFNSVYWYLCTLLYCTTSGIQWKLWTLQCFFFTRKECAIDLINNIPTPCVNTFEQRWLNMTLYFVWVWSFPYRLSNAVTPLLRKPYAEQLQMKVADIKHALNAAAKEIRKANPVSYWDLFERYSCVIYCEKRSSWHGQVFDIMWLLYYLLNFRIEDLLLL